jgi:hypothetical protein
MGPQQPYAGALLHNTVEGAGRVDLNPLFFSLGVTVGKTEVTMPDKPGNACASSFKSDTLRFKCVRQVDVLNPKPLCFLRSNVILRVIFCT